MYYVKRLLNRFFGCRYKLDIYPQFFGGDEESAKLIREERYDEYNELARKSASHSLDGGKTIHTGMFHDCKICKNMGYKSFPL